MTTQAKESWPCQTTMMVLCPNRNTFWPIHVASMLVTSLFVWTTLEKFQTFDLFQGQAVWKLACDHCCLETTNFGRLDLLASSPPRKRDTSLPLAAMSVQRQSRWDPPSCVKGTMTPWRWILNQMIIAPVSMRFQRWLIAQFSLCHLVDESLQVHSVQKKMIRPPSEHWSASSTEETTQ